MSGRSVKIKGVKGKVYFDGDQRIYGLESEVLHFHITPPRPVCIVVTLDPDLGSVNAMSGTFGPCTWQPLTFHLHFNNKLTSHTYYNLKATKECVIALPGKDLIKQTWIINLPTPRGINELEVAGLTPIPSRYVKPPGIKECPVNLECVLELTYDLYMTGLAVVRVVGGSIDEDLVEIGSKDRPQILKRYPIYEVDTAHIPQFVPERFGLIGEVIDCPLFPVGLTFGPGGSTGLVEWMAALRDKGYITDEEFSKIIELFTRWEHFPERIAFSAESSEKSRIKQNLTMILHLICWEKWDDLHKYLSAI